MTIFALLVTLLQVEMVALKLLNPFTNSSGHTPESFRLSAAISGWDGYNVCTSLLPCDATHTYNIDAFGTTRTTWTRGAFEFVSASAPVAGAIAGRRNTANGITAKIQGGGMTWKVR